VIEANSINHNRQTLLCIALFASSACGLIIEIVAGRLLAPYVGMSLYTWTAIIAVVLAGLSVGHWIGGILAPPHVKVRTGLTRAGWALAASAVSTLAILILLRFVASLLMPSSLNPISVIVILSTALFFLPSFFVGIVSPILTKLAVDEDKGRHPGKIIGRMYALGTLGSIAGTLLAGFIFISWIGSVGTVLLVSAVYSALAISFFLIGSVRSTTSYLVLLFLMLSGTSMLGAKLQAFTSPCHIESDYFCIRIDEAPSFAPTARLMALDHLVHSINDSVEPSLFYSPYIHFVDEYTKQRMGNDPPSTYFIGGGGFSLPRAWVHEYKGTANLIAVEIDPAVTKAAINHLWLKPKKEGLKIVHQDARAYLQSLPMKPTFDVIFGDAFHDITIPQHLVTHEFHEEIADRLNPQGFYVLNVVDNIKHPRFLLAIAKTLFMTFPYVEVWVERGRGVISGRETFLVTGSKHRSPDAILLAHRGLPRSWVRWPDSKLRRLIEEPKVLRLTDDLAPVDRLMSNHLLAFTY
tara:strand:+ start:3608 stop:5173 length:1566 start_codon:yes stop_codon:yes gene_type:complete